MTLASACPPLAAPLADVTSERLHLRRFRPGDGELLAPAFAKTEFWQFPYGRGFTVEETAAFVADQIEEWDRYGLGC